MIYEEDKNEHNIDPENTGLEDQSESNLEEVENLKSENERLLRAYAGLVNEQKRGSLDKENVKRETIRRFFIEAIAPFLGLVEQAKSHLTEEMKNDPVIGGIDTAIKKLNEDLGKFMIVPIEIEKGVTQLNPEYHDVISSIDGEKDVILEEYQKGYIMKSREGDEEYVLLASKVVVGNGN